MHILRVIRASAVGILLSIFAVGFAAPAFALPSNTPDVMPQTNGRVYAITYVGNTVYIGGSFTSVRPAGASSGGTTRNNIAAIDATTGNILSFNPNANGDVQAITVDSNGTVYFGGSFTTVGGQVRTRLAAITSAGTLTSWAPAANDTVLSMAVVGSNVYAGGQFGTLDGQRRPNLGSISTSGTVSAWSPAPDSRVEAVEVSASGSNLYFGGKFKVFAGVTKRFAVETDLSGTVMASWKPKVSYPVNAISNANASVYIGEAGPGGTVEAVDQTTGAAKWSAKGDGNVQAIAASSTAVYVGGHFQNFAGAVRNKLVALNVSNGSALGWNPTANSSLGVWELTLNGNHLGVGGDFTVIGGVKQQGFAQYTGSL